MVWRSEDPQGNEAAKVKHAIVRYTRGVVLDFGCGPSKAFPHFVGVDSLKDVELFGIEMKPDAICDVSDPADVAETFHEVIADAIFSSHTLEHIEDYEGALEAWWKLIKVGGHLVLYLPHAAFYPNVGTEGANHDHKHDFEPSDVAEAMRAITSLTSGSGTGFDLVVNEERNGGREYSFLQVYQKLAEPGVQRQSWKAPKPAKTCCIVRHGGIGDQLMAAQLLPELKRQGYHVTMLTTPRGKAPIEHDPNIDDWYIVDVDQVPNHELGAFWHETAKSYDKFVNLNESVEGVFLALPGRIQHTWPHDVRHSMMNRNYGEFAAMLAGIPFKPEGRFWPTDDERAWALEHRTKLTAKLNEGLPDFMQDVPAYVIMWTLSGSSPHKFTPHQDTVIRMILGRLKRAIVVLTGDMACKILEAGWETTPRVVCTSGELDVRQTLALAQQCDLVIGPETGVLNAVAYETMTKVALLSHSSPENLTKHWTNTVAVEGRSACYPCHMLHYDRTFCPCDPETGAALCQVGVAPAAIYHPIDAAYTAWSKVQLIRNSVPA